MKPLDRLSDYLGAIERRLRLLAWTRGAAVTAAAALSLTVLAVLVANQFSFSNPSVIGARVFLFLGLAAAVAVALIVPVIRLNRRHAARKAETRYPHFEERLLTFTERVEKTPNDPFLHLLAADTLQVAQHTEPKEVARTAVLFSFSSAAVVAMLTLIWLGMSGPGFLGYGTSLLWGGLPKGEMKPFYAIQVEPGDKTIRKRADLLVSATLMGFQAPKVRFFAKFVSASKWEEAEMRSGAGSAAYQFLYPGVPESMEYYVEAAGVRSETYKVKVIDLPAVKKTRVTYNFPAWTGMKNEVEDPGGDLRAVEGTVAEVEVTTDRTLANGILVLDDGSKISLTGRSDGTVVANVPIQKDGRFYIAAVEGGEDVRLTDDYFIEAMKDTAPELRITRPGRDFRATPIEEVTVTVEAKDDFGLKEVSLRYSVNGGAEKAVPMLRDVGAKNGSGSTIIALEDFKLVPGDVVSIYATAKDARKTVTTDMFFIEAQPFERNYTQSQQAGGGGGGGGDDAGDQAQISARQKEIITATWNQVKGQGAKGTDKENATFLSGVQSKLRDQAKSLADRMKARQLEGAGDSFKSFVEDMEKAVEAMGPASEKLKIAKWQESLQPEQKALQHLLRAEATFRDIQVAFGQQRGGGGGGGGGGGATRDLQGLFDLELDTEKNQYESAQRGMQGGGDSQQKKVDEALQKLKELAKRQQELAEQQRRGQQKDTAKLRYEQEQLRREAEQIKQQLEQMQQGGQLSRNGDESQQGQQGQQQGQQQGGQQQGGQQQQSGQQQQAGQQNGQQSLQQQMQQQQQQRAQQQQQGMNGANQQRIQQLIDTLKQATEDMRAANNANQAGTPQGEAQARRAAERLRDAEQMFSGLRGQQSSNQLQNLVQQADELARKQQDFEGQMRRAYGGDRGVTREQAEQLARQRDQEAAELKKLEQGMQSAARDLQSTQRQASTKVREALGEMQQMELGRDMQRNAQWIRQGMGQYAVMSEAQITAGLNEVRDQLKEAQQAMGKDGQGAQNDAAVEAALRQVEQLRRQYQQFGQQQQGQRGQGQRGQQQGGQQPGGQQQGQQQNGQQGGQQQGQQQGGQQGGQQQGQQQGGQQGGQQQGGQQGGQQAGGQQSGGQQGGQQQGGQQGGQQAGGQRGGQQNGGNGGSWNGGAWNGGNWDGRGPYTDGPVRMQDLQQTYREAMQSLQQLSQEFRDDPNGARDIQGLMRGLREFDPMAIGNDPLLSQRIQAALAGVEQVEMELRKKVEANIAGGTVRSSSTEKMPDGYEKQVQEYFRKIAK